MATFNWETLDANYPVAGVDNDTQGFRDNFNIIKDALQVAETNVTTLENDTVKNNASNNFLGNEIVDATFTAVTEKYFDKSLGDAVYSGGQSTVSFLQGHHQRLVVDQNTTVTLDDWPGITAAGGARFAKMTVLILRDTDENADNYVITWNVPSGTLKTDPDWPASFTINSAEDPTFAEFWTYDGGQTVYGKYLGRFS